MTTIDNPLGLDGFEFCEFTSPEPEALAAQFEQMGFTATHRHPTRNITRERGARRDAVPRRRRERRALKAALRGQGCAIDRRGSIVRLSFHAFNGEDDVTAAARALGSVEPAGRC